MIAPALLLVLFLFPSTSWGAWHLYVTNIIGVGTRYDMHRPDVVGNLGGIRYSVYPFGKQGFALVAADVTNAQDAAISAAPGIIKIPDNLDQTIGGALATVQGLLEARNIPAGWVTSGMTYRTLIKTIMGMFAFMQRFPQVTGVVTKLIDGTNITLNTTFGSLPLQTRQRLQAVAQSFKFDTSGITAGTTIRQILKSVSDQWIAQKGGIKVGEIVIASVPLYEQFYHWLIRDILSPTLAWAITFTDNFNRSNANPLDGSWTNDVANPLELVGGRVRGINIDPNNPGTYLGQAKYTGFSPADDQTAQVTFASLLNYGFIGTNLRWNASNNGYVFGCHLAGFLIWTEDPTFRIIALDETSGCVQGDVIKGDAASDALTFYVNNVVILSQTDAAITSGNCGLRVEAWVDAPDVEADNFICQDGTSPPAAPRRRSVMVQ